jgi:hypothetical protein
VNLLLFIDCNLIFVKNKIIPFIYIGV